MSTTWSGTPDHPVEVDEYYLRLWASFGVAQIERYLGNDSRFREWCKRTGREIR